MTEPPSGARNRLVKAWLCGMALMMIIAVAAVLRLRGVNAGLPALNDPDEPLFMMTALEMLRDQSLNPGWFGHPGTTTLYCLALTSLAVAATGIATGHFADAQAFVAALYADPGIVVLPARIVMALSGVACVFLTYRIGARIGGARLGIIAALFLAVNAVHVEYSQIIRTDVQAGLFMLLATLSAIAIAESGKRRDFILAGLCVGLACATKWPAAAVLVSPIVAGMARGTPGHRAWRDIALLLFVSLATLLVVSPYLLLDYPAVLRNLAGEARVHHPGSTGSDFLSNLAWYVAHPLYRSLGAVGLIFSLAGLVWISFRQRVFRLAILPTLLVFTAIICSQALVWERWIVPLLPFFALGAAQAVCTIAAWLGRKDGASERAFQIAASLLLAIPMLLASWTGTTEKLNDTRQIASSWVRTHVPRGSAILIEDAAFDLLRGPWRFLFPIGSAGCVDAREALSGKIRYSKVEKLRTGSPIIDVGHVDATQLPTCRGDYALLTHYDRYRKEAASFRPELEQYRKLLAGSRVRAIIRPVRGTSSGPNVIIVEFGPLKGSETPKTMSGT